MYNNDLIEWETCTYHLKCSNTSLTRSAQALIAPRCSEDIRGCVGCLKTQINYNKIKNTVLFEDNRYGCVCVFAL
ncbi:hypothetical protein HanPSC8_Chr13g0586861 [Helianthus annuus]|nr:hypothetical protein HanPSC8_Chr13g0586861 [Helianthus annuus]